MRLTTTHRRQRTLHNFHSPQAKNHGKEVIISLSSVFRKPLKRQNQSERKFSRRYVTNKSIDIELVQELVTIVVSGVQVSRRSRRIGRLRIQSIRRSIH